MVTCSPGMSALEQLRAAYVPRLVAQIDTLEPLLEAGDGAEARRIAHKIAGAAGSYGLAEVSVLARQLEHALDAGADPAGQREVLAAIREAVPEVAATASGAVILVVGDYSSERDDVVVAADPLEALEHAMDRELLALVVPYSGGARGGRALLRSLSAMDEVRGVPIYLTEVSEDEHTSVCKRVGAAQAFAGPVDESVLDVVREQLA